MSKATPTLRDLIEMGSRYAAGVFAIKGEYTPGVYHAVTADEQCLIIPDPPVADQQLALAIMRDLFIEKDVVAYVYASEAWAKNADRSEVIILVAESETEGALIGERRIVRPKDKGEPPYLAPLELKPFTTSNASLLAHKTTLH